MTNIAIRPIAAQVVTPADRKWIACRRYAALVLTSLMMYSPAGKAQSTEAAAEPSAPKSAVVDSQGTVRVPSFELPQSTYASPAARESLTKQLRMAKPDRKEIVAAKAAEVRQAINAYLAPLLQRMQALYPVEIGSRMLGGIHALAVTPKSGVSRANRGRVLVNLHGGGFWVGDSGTVGLLEAIPIAAAARIEVITIDYRQGPEYQFPAASEDVVKVYKALLKQFAARNIGIYGCSAGGLLAAEAEAWIQKEALPSPGALGILCASADARWAGDTYFTGAALAGDQPPAPGAPADYDEKYYYGNHDLNSPLMSPVLSREVLSRFPPTLILTATRAPELSAAVHTDVELTKAGVRSELHVWDGLWHGFFMDPDLPESREAYDIIVSFFGRTLGRGPTK